MSVGYFPPRHRAGTDPSRGDGFCTEQGTSPYGNKVEPSGFHGDLTIIEDPGAEGGEMPSDLYQLCTRHAITVLRIWDQGLLMVRTHTCAG